MGDDEDDGADTDEKSEETEQDEMSYGETTEDDDLIMEGIQQRKAGNKNKVA